MLDIGEDNSPGAKCFFTAVHLPQYVDSHQPPTKKKPFSCVLEKPFIHTIDVLGPKDTVNALQTTLQPSLSKQRYARVQMRLLDLVEGDFFNTYIKSGDILMLSAGEPGVNNTFSLSSGILTLDLDKPTYERAGLVGKAIPSPGRKHNKHRYRVELNLRLPSMVRGRPGFNRLIHACRTVLTQEIKWLFADLAPPSDSSAPVAAFDPVRRDLDVTIEPMEDHLVPFFPLEADVGSEALTEWLEYLSLAFMGSARLRAGHEADPALCRYSVPELVGAEPERCDLARLHVRGMVPATVAAGVLAKCIGAVRREGDSDDAAGEGRRPWVAIRVQSFHGGNCVIFISSGRACIWEYEH